MLFVLAACGTQRYISQSAQQLREGQYAAAVSILEAGVQRHPDDIELRKAMVRARADGATSLLSRAGAQREQGDLDAAEATLQEALKFDAASSQAAAMIQAISVERRQRAALRDAQALVDTGKPTNALRLVQEALKENRRFEPLLQLRRQLEGQARQAQFKSAQAGLSERRPISLDFRDASLRSVLDLVSRNSGINFILDKDIRPDLRTTVYLRSARVEDAVDLILSTNGLAKKLIDSQTILIYPNTPEKQREHQEQIVKVFYLANADAKNAAAYLKAMLKVRDPYVDERTNMLTLRESPDNIELAERLIALFDASEPEVLLELEVLEVNSNRLLELGVQFPDSFSLTVLPPADTTRLTLGNLGGVNRDRIGVSVSSLLVNLKRTVGDVNTLSAPRIRVKNKEKAKVLVGNKIPVITATNGTGGFVSDSVNYIDVGLKLEVEPSVSNDDDVVIKVALEVSSAGNQVKSPSGTIAYEIGTRNASTVLRLRDGQTQLLAGLISREERSNSSRLPGLGDVPVLGRLFSSQLDSAQRNELMLAITPHVLRNVQQLDPSESELWIGSESFQRLRPAFGRNEVAAASGATAVPGIASLDSARSGIGALPPVGGVPLSSVTAQWIGPEAVAVGEMFEVALMVKTTVGIRGMPLMVNFPKANLELVEVTEEDFFRKNGNPTSFAKTIDTEAGQLRVGVQRQLGVGATGEGKVVTLKFKALAKGPAEVTVVGMEPMGQDAPVPRPALPVNHRMTVR